MKWIESGAQLNRRMFLTYSARAAAIAAALPYARGFANNANAPSTDPVATRSGKVRGKTVEDVHMFLGVPYGAPTGGARRFLAPAREAAWTEVRDVFEYGPVAPNSGRPRGQKMMQFFSPLRATSAKGESEDCLYLNVWTRSLGGAKRPVMVWLHGGGYDQGSGGSPGYSGEDHARDHDVVAVSINHRLNVLGYLYLGGVLGDEFAESANQGQLDIVAALNWVQENIEAFGGDPNRVMIYGQSGGGGKVVNIMGMPSAKGLFHSAAIQSGGSRGGDPAAATESAEQLLKAFGLSKANARDLQKAPLDQLMKVAAGVKNDAALPVGAEPLNLRWGPVIDGKVIPEDPNASPLSKDIPAIQGFTHTERTVYTIDGDSYGALTDADLKKEVIALVGEEKADDIIAMYRKEYADAKPFAMSFYITSDVRDPGTFASARNAKNQAPTWVYRWDWETPVMDLLAPHCMEIPFVMSHIDDCTAMVGDAISEEIRMLEAQASGAWVALATNGNPNHKGLIEWPAYTDETKAVMCFDTPCHVEQDPGAELRKVLLPNANRSTFGL